MDAIQIHVTCLMFVCLAVSAWTSVVDDEDDQHEVHSVDSAFLSRTKREYSYFPCPILGPSSPRPNSVHRLRPADFSVIGAIGDSLTAGRGVVGGAYALFFDYRYLSWSIGGDGSYPTTITLPNILRQYNPFLYGYATKDEDRFNVAVTGAKVEDAYEQAEKLVRLMQTDKNVEYANHWKLITVFIGANDLCDFCEDDVMYSAANYKHKLQRVLDYLFVNVPRAYVNLFLPLNLEVVINLKNTDLCEAVHAFACDCASNPDGIDSEIKLLRLRTAYQDAARELVESGIYDQRDDFTVVVQPGFSNLKLPKTPTGQTDMSYFASDCFHLSRKGQAGAAVTLWNNMFSRPAEKQTTWLPDQTLKCPTERHPYLYTSKNVDTK